MEATHEKTYRSPQRKLVKFFERSRNQWKVKAGAAKRGLKRLGTRVRRLERSKADYQHQLEVLQTQVAEWQAKHAQTRRELEELKKKYPQLSRDF
jgi:chromosome segregation ATPase